MREGACGRGAPCGLAPIGADTGGGQPGGGTALEDMGKDPGAKACETGGDWVGRINALSSPCDK